WEQLHGGLPEGVLGRIGIDLFAADTKTLYATIENLNPLATPPPEPKTEPGNGGSEGGRREPDAETLADPLAPAEFFGEFEEQEGERAPRGKIQGGEVWRSDDAGATWRKTNTTPIGGEPGYYYGQIRVDPAAVNTVYVLSVPVYKSTDGGKT